MNFTQINLILKNILALLLVVLLTTPSAFGDEVYSKMASETASPQFDPLPASQVIDYYTKKQKSQKLSPNESDILKLSRLAQDIFEIKDFKVSQRLKTEKEKVESLTVSHLAIYIQENIESRPNWNESLSPAQIDQIKESSEIIKKTLTTASTAWAWVCYHTNQKEESKKILSTKFENTYSDVMKLTSIYRHHSNPLIEAENAAKILKPMSTSDEIKDREQKIKKMQTHISTLPDMQIMT